MSDRMTRRRFNGALLGGLAAAALPLRAARALEPLTFQANWLNDPEFIGYMMGIEGGAYAQAGLGVTYLSGGPDLIPEGAVLSGKADVALTAMVTTAKAIAEKGAPLTIIGTQYQKSPIGVISLAETKITGPRDLAGKTVACPPLSVAQLQAVLALNKVASKDVRVVPFTFDPAPLLNGSVDAAVDFVTQLPFMIEKAGKKASTFLFYDHGLPLYIDLVVVSERTLRDKRPQLARFLRVSRAMWAENFRDPVKYPTAFQTSWLKGTGGALDAEIAFNVAQQALMEHPGGYFSLDRDGIQRNLAALAELGIQAGPAMFDTSILNEL